MYKVVAKLKLVIMVICNLRGHPYWVHDNAMDKRNMFLASL